MRSTGSVGASINWNSAWPNLPPDAPATNGLAADAEDLAAVFARVAKADRALIAGIAAYRQSAYVRDMRDPPTIWEEGETRLLDYGGDGPLILFVPSLINRAYILDLMPGGSMLRWLAEHAAHPYLLDWGWPAEPERKFSLTDYIAGRLERAIAALPGPIILAGYCMGGLLALAAALRQPAKISALALLATPWDFHAADAAAAKRLGDAVPMLDPMLNFSGTLSIDALQTLFTAIDPHGVGEKYRSFAELDKTTLRARRFVAMEDWLADGVPLAAPVAREILAGWYGANAPGRGQWRIAGLPADPTALNMPSFVAIPARDRLVPPESAAPLAALLRHATVARPRAGHIGMIAGTNAETELWQPFADWLMGL
jgi:polyhydroxyalkanoate synthase